MHNTKTFLVYFIIKILYLFIIWIFKDLSIHPSCMFVLKMLYLFIYLLTSLQF